MKLLLANSTKQANNAMCKVAYIQSASVDNNGKSHAFRVFLDVAGSVHAQTSNMEVGICVDESENSC